MRSPSWRTFQLQACAESWPGLAALSARPLHEQLEATTGGPISDRRTPYRNDQDPAGRPPIFRGSMGTGRPRGALAGAGGGEVLGYQPPKVSSMKNWMGSRRGLPIRSDPSSRW